MRNVILAIFITSLLSGNTKAESTNFPNDFRLNAALLEKQCGYVLDKNLSAQVYKSSSNVSEKTVSVDFYLRLVPTQRTIQGKLSFSCLKAEFSRLSLDAPQKTTATEEIALEDSGGRYARDIVWQRKYKGSGWTGTIAYINSVSGDQTKRAIPDYFFVCPDRSGITCFSFEVEKNQLKKMEIDRIPKLLHNISLVDLKNDPQ